jgi:predicted nucleic acid-binding Zn ribbon protein
MAKKTITVPRHKKDMPLTEVTFTCGECGQVFTVMQYPGKPPTYCKPCQAERRRAAARERMRRNRAAKKSGE